MCRQNQLWGWCLAAFGLGLLFGAWIESGFWNLLLAFGLIGCGLGIAKHR